LVRFQMYKKKKMRKARRKLKKTKANEKKMIFGCARYTILFFSSSFFLFGVNWPNLSYFMIQILFGWTQKFIFVRKFEKILLWNNFYMFD
jgi:hypothetical protein